MKILIGTPIHQIKDYSMERWLESVSKLLKSYPADLLLVDNSPTPYYIEQVKKYCKKYEIRKYKLIHIDCDQGMTKDIQDRRIEKSQEFIRQEVLSGDYDAWFSWECDQLIPTNALGKLVKLIKIGNIMVIAHNSWARNYSTHSNFDMGCTLITRQCLKKYGFLQKEGKHDFYKIRVLEGGGNFVEVRGLISPIYHLNA